jgi:hypothetical protein
MQFLMGYETFDCDDFNSFKNVDIERIQYSALTSMSKSCKNGPVSCSVPLSFSMNVCKMASQATDVSAS